MLEGCNIQEGILHPTTVNFHNNVTIEDIQNIYEPAGFEFYKLEGRTLPLSENAGSYVRYLIKPEYQLHAMASLIGDR